MASLFPVFNAFMIMFIVLALFSIMGTSFFADEAPEQFGNMTRSLLTLMRVAGGDTWVEGIPILLENGEVNMMPAAFIFIYIIVVCWTLLQVSVAVLLDNFVAETARGKEEEERHTEEAHRKIQINHMLDPLLRRFVQTYVNDEDMSRRLGKLFYAIKGDSAGNMTASQFAAGLGRLNLNIEENGMCQIDSDFYYDGRKENLEARAREELLQDLNGSTQIVGIHMSELDFDEITEQGTLTDIHGDLGVDEFKTVMRKQIFSYAQRMIHESLAQTDPGDKEIFGDRVCLKMLLADVTAMKAKICTAEGARGAEWREGSSADEGVGMFARGHGAGKSVETKIADLEELIHGISRGTAQGESTILLRLAGLEEAIGMTVAPEATILDRLSAVETTVGTVGSVSPCPSLTEAGRQGPPSLGGESMEGGRRRR